MSWTSEYLKDTGSDFLFYSATHNLISLKAVSRHNYDIIQILIRLNDIMLVSTIEDSYVDHYCQKYKIENNAICKITLQNGNEYVVFKSYTEMLTVMSKIGNIIK